MAEAAPPAEEGPQVTILDLPLDAFGRILAYLRACDRAQTLVCCRAWHAAASENPVAWAHVCVRLPRPRAVESFGAWLAPRRHLIETLHLSQVLWQGLERSWAAEELLHLRALARGSCRRYCARLEFRGEWEELPARLQLSSGSLSLLPRLEHFELHALDAVAKVTFKPSFSSLTSLTALVLNVPAHNSRGYGVTPALPPAALPPALRSFGTPCYPTIPAALAAAPRLEALVCCGTMELVSGGRPPEYGMPLTLSCSCLDQLRGLTSLALTGCGLRSLPAALAQLTGLRRLDASHNPLLGLHLSLEESSAEEVWAPLSALTALTCLKLVDCGLKTAPLAAMVAAGVRSATAVAAGGPNSGGSGGPPPPLPPPRQLSLDLSENALLRHRGLEPLRHLGGALRELSLRRCELRRLPAWLWASVQALDLTLCTRGELVVPRPPAAVGVTRLVLSMEDAAGAQGRNGLAGLGPSLQELYFMGPLPFFGEWEEVLGEVASALPALRVCGFLHGLENVIGRGLAQLAAARPDVRVVVDRAYGRLWEDCAWEDFVPRAADLEGEGASGSEGTSECPWTLNGSSTSGGSSSGSDSEEGGGGRGRGRGSPGSEAGSEWEEEGGEGPGWLQEHVGQLWAEQVQLHGEEAMQHLHPGLWGLPSGPPTRAGGQPAGGDVAERRGRGGRGGKITPSLVGAFYVGSEAFVGVVLSLVLFWYVVPFLLRLLRLQPL